jgi:S1-C subfamily serine protease
MFRCSVFLVSLLLAAAAARAQDPVDSPPEKSPLVEELEGMAQRVLNRAGPIVVAIRVQREKEPAPPNPTGNNRPSVFRTRPESPTSGMILDSEGHILTSQFNVSGKVQKIEVEFDGRVYEAALVGFNGTLDVALLKIDASGLPVPTMGDATKLRVGDPVYALGRCPDGKGLTIDPGVVSATDRYGNRCLQHDGSANFGNAGGPLVDAHGRVVGITGKISTGRGDRFGQNSGISFATRWDRIEAFLPQLKSGAKLETEQRPYLGVENDAEFAGRGAGIARAQPGSAAEKAGIKDGDVIVEFGGRRINSWNELTDAIRARRPGDKVKLKVKRGEEELELEVELGSAADN